MSINPLLNELIQNYAMHHNMSVSFVNKIAFEYNRALYIYCYYQFYPSQLIYDFWLYHISKLTNYKEYCMIQYKKIINHRPPVFSSIECEKRVTNINNTIKKYNDIFGPVKYMECWTDSINLTLQKNYKNEYKNKNDYIKINIKLYRTHFHIHHNNTSNQNIASEHILIKPGETLTYDNQYDEQLLSINNKKNLIKKQIITGELTSYEIKYNDTILDLIKEIYPYSNSAHDTSSLYTIDGILCFNKSIDKIKIGYDNPLPVNLHIRQLQSKYITIICIDSGQYGYC